MRAARGCNAAADSLDDDGKLIRLHNPTGGSAGRLLDAAGAATATIPSRLAKKR